MDVGAAIRLRLPRALGRRVNTSSNRSPNVVARSPPVGPRKIEPGESERAASSLDDAECAGVVAAAAIGIDEGFVGVEDLPEARRRLAVARIDVRMKSTRQPAIGPLDLGRPMPRAATPRRM